MMTKGEQTRLSLVKAAQRSFSANGFDGLTFADLAKELQIRPSAIYVYFDNKIDLLLACAMHAAQEGRDFIDRYIDPTAPAPDRLRGYLLGNLNWILQYRKEAYSLVALYYFSRTDAKLLALHRQIEEKGIERISILIRQGCLERAWEAPGLETSARLVRSLLVGEMLRAFHFPREYQSPGTARSIELAALSILRASEAV
jgi:AcrR family transcriptional regulator